MGRPKGSSFNYITTARRGSRVKRLAMLPRHQTLSERLEDLDTMKEGCRMYIDDLDSAKYELSKLSEERTKKFEARKAAIEAKAARKVEAAAKKAARKAASSVRKMTKTAVKKAKVAVDKEFAGKAAKVAKKAARPRKAKRPSEWLAIQASDAAKAGRRRSKKLE